MANEVEKNIDSRYLILEMNNARTSFGGMTDEVINDYCRQCRNMGKFFFYSGGESRWGNNVGHVFFLDDKVLTVADNDSSNSDVNVMRSFKQITVDAPWGKAAGLFNRCMLGYIKEYVQSAKPDDYSWIANMYYAQGEYDKAFEYYNKAAKNKAEDTSLICRIGNVYLGKGDYTQALSEYAKAIALCGKFKIPMTAEPYYGRAIAYFYQGFYDKAWDELDRVRELPLGNIDYDFLKKVAQTAGETITRKYADYYMRQGFMAVKEKNYDQAIKLYSIALTIVPSSTAVYLLRGQVYELKHSSQKSGADYEKADKIPVDVHSCYQLGNLYLFDNEGEVSKREFNYPKATELYTKALAAAAGNDQVELYRKRALCYFYSRDYAKAWADVSKIQDYVSSQFAERLKTAVRLQADIDSRYAHIDRYNQILSEKQNDFQTYFDRAQAYHAIAESSREILYLFFDQLIVLDGNETIHYQDYWDWWEAYKVFYENAVSDYTKALELKPDELQIYLGRAQAYARSLANKESLRDYDTVIAKNPALIDAYFGEVDLYGPKQALAVLNKITEIDPKDVRAYTGRIQLYLAGINKKYPVAFLQAAYAGYLVVKKPQVLKQCLDEYTKAIAAAPREIKLYVGRAEIYCAQKAYNAAIADYTKALELNSRDVALYIGRANVHYQRKDFDAMVSDYSQAIDINPYDTHFYFFPESQKEKLKVLYCKRAEKYSSKNDWYRAAVDYSKAIDLDSENYDLYQKRGDVNYKKGDYEESSLDYTKVIKLLPGAKKQDISGVYEKRARAYIQIAEYDKARSDIEQMRILGKQVPGDLIEQLKNK